MGEAQIIKGSRIRPFVFMLIFSIVLFMIFVLLFGLPRSGAVVLVLFVPAISSGLRALMFKDLYMVKLTDQNITGPSKGLSTRTVSFDNTHGKLSRMRTMWNELEGDHYIRSTRGQTIVINAMVFNKEQRQKIFDAIDVATQQNTEE